MGRDLLAWAEDRARELEVSYLRLDCWADNAHLRAYYEELGFEQCDTYVDDGWRGVVLQSRLRAGSAEQALQPDALDVGA